MSVKRNLTRIRVTWSTTVATHTASAARQHFSLFSFVNGISMRFLWSIISCAVAFLALVNAKSSSGDSVLVILEPGLQKEDYSIFFSGLEGLCLRAFPCTMRTVKCTLCSDEVCNLTFREGV